MALELRGITSDEMEQAEAISLVAFGDSERHALAPVMERMRRDFKPEWYLAAFEDGEMTSMMRIIPAAMRINGAALPFGTVSPVASSPLHRRRGHTGQLLRHSLAVMRDAGQVVSGLYTPHPALYRRYGWEIAAGERRYEFQPKDCRLAVRPRERGRLRQLKAEDWPELDAVFRRFSEKRNGPLVRDELWWYRLTFGVDIGSWHGGVDAVAWDDGEGATQGYVLVRLPGGNLPAPEARDAGKVQGLELVALTPDAYLNLVAFLAGHDIFRGLVLYAPLDDPLPLLFEDAERLTIEEHYTVLLRVVDVEAALRLRPLADAALEAEFRLAVRDECAPWNQATWRVRAAGGAVEVERGSGDADIEVDALYLAPLFNGYLKPSRAAAGGLLQARDASALARADAFFRPLHPPYFTDRF